MTGAAIGGMSGRQIHLWFRAFTRCKCNIYEPESKGSQTGNAALVDTRFDHPKLGIAADKVFGIGAEVRAVTSTPFGRRAI